MMAPVQARNIEAKGVKPFTIVEATIEGIHAAFKAGTLTARQLVQMYLDRIAAYDKTGPAGMIRLRPEPCSRRVFRSSYMS